MGPTSATSAPVLEVFASVQGEGAYAGEPQVFLRLSGCPMRCRWCDTPGSWGMATRARVAAPGGARREPAWASPFQAACWIAEVEPGSPRPVSVTGGEPLLWPEFLLALRGMIGERRLHLETAGGHPRTLERVLAVCDHVSLDLKLPADLDPPQELARAELAPGAGATEEPAPLDEDGWREARRTCLRLVSERDAAAKVVVAGGRSPRDFEPLFEDLVRIAPGLPLFVQPATPVGGVPAPSPQELLEVYEAARDEGLAVRVVPQLHRALGVP